MLRSKVERAGYYLASKIDLKVVDECGVVLHKRSVNGLYLSGDIYYVGDWRKPVTMYHLVRELSRFFSKEEVSLELNVLLLSSFEEGLEWLDSQGFDTSVLPDSIINRVKGSGVQFIDNRTSQPASTSSFAHSNEAQFVDNRTSEQKAFSEVIGRKAEGFVFRELVQFYKNKYSDSQILVEDDGWFETDQVKIIWHAKRGYENANHDIKIEEKGEVKFIEVKSTIGDVGSDCNIYFSWQEWSLMCESMGKYFIARVFNSENPSEITFVKMQVVNHPGEE